MNANLSLSDAYILANIDVNLFLYNPYRSINADVSLSLSHCYMLINININPSQKFSLKLTTTLPFWYNVPQCLVFSCHHD